MSGLRVLLAALCLAGPMWLAAAVPAHACSCAGQTDETIRQTELIVIGVVRDLRFVGDVPPGPTAEPGITPPPLLSTIGAEVVWTVVVEEYLKGSGPGEIEVHSNAAVTYDAEGRPAIYPGTTPSCSYAPEDAARYLFLVSTRSDAVNETGACSGSTIITAENEANIAEYIQKIRDALAAPDGLPDTGSRASRNDPSLSMLAAAGIGAALASIVVFAPLVVRRRER